MGAADRRRAASISEDDGKRSRLAEAIDSLDEKYPGLAPSRPVGILLSSAVTMLVALLSNLTGVLRSLSPVCWPWRPPLSWCWTLSPADLNVAGVALVALTIFQAFVLYWATRRQGREKAAADEEARTAKSAEEEWRRQADKALADLADSVASVKDGQLLLPTNRLMALFREGMNAAIQSALAASASTKSAEIFDAIRAVLSVIASTVAEYDAAVRTILVQRPTYSASIFLHFPTKGLSLSERDRLSQGLRFVPTGTSLEALPGVLELQVAWSMSTGIGREDGADGRLLPLVLPLRQPEDPGALPGAAQAWCTKSIVRISRAREMHEQILLSDPTAAELAEVTKAFFRSGEGEHIGSFICLPVACPNDTSRPPIGTVNVNCSIPDMLPDDRQVVLIATFLQMLTFLLPGMISRAHHVTVMEAQKAAKAAARRGRRSGTPRGQNGK